MIDKYKLSPEQFKTIGDAEDLLKNVVNILNGCTTNGRLSAIAKTQIKQSALWVAEALAYEYRQ